MKLTEGGRSEYWKMQYSKEGYLLCLKGLDKDEWYSLVQKVKRIAEPFSAGEIVKAWTTEAPTQ